MLAALLSSQTLTLSEWEPHVSSKAVHAKSYERRWQRFLSNRKINGSTELAMQVQLLKCHDNMLLI